MVHTGICTQWNIKQRLIECWFLSLPQFASELVDKVCKLMGAVLSFLQRLVEMQVRGAMNTFVLGSGWNLREG